jgi:hypothetical protein
LVEQVDAPSLRNYLIWLESEGHNPGGVHACYRAARAFLLWWRRKLRASISPRAA